MAENRPVYLPPSTPPAEGVKGGAAAVRVLAGPGRRIAARAVDAGVWTAVVLGLALLTTAATASGSAPAARTVAMVAVCAVGAALVLTRLAAIALWGRTFGQAVAGVEVVAYADGRSRPSWAQSYARWYGRFRIAEDVVRFVRDREEEQCSHDENAGTAVVRYAASGAGAGAPGGSAFVVSRWSGNAHRLVMGAGLGIVLAAEAGVLAVVLARG